MIATAISRFHKVRNTVPSHPVTVATSARIDDPKFRMEPPSPKVVVGDGDGDQGTKDTGTQKNDKPVLTPTKPGGDSGQSKTNPTGSNPPGGAQTGGNTGAGGNAGGASGPTAGATSNTTVVPQASTTQKAAPNPPGFVTNIYQGMDIRDVLSDAASMAKVTIIPDESIKTQNVSIEFNNTPIEKVVDQLASYVGAYWKEDAPGVYLISKAAPDSSMFPRMAITRMYHVHNQTAATIQLLLSAAYKNYVSVDPKTNQIGVCAPKVMLEKIMDDIKAADRPGRQVTVAALITEMSAEDALNSGFSFSGKNLSLGSDLSLNYQTAGFSDMVKIQAALNNHKASLRADPKVTAIEGTEAIISVGTDNYFSLLSGSTTFPTSQIQLIHTGVVLKYTAFVDDDGWITMQLDPQVSDAVVVQNGNPQNQVRSASTKVRVRSGDSIIIGGLIQQSTDHQIVRVPILGYIPIIGELFTQRTTDKKKIETIIAITPTLVPEQK